MENASTGVLGKIKNNIEEVKIKPKNDMMHKDMYNFICQNTKKLRYTFLYISMILLLSVLPSGTLHWRYNGRDGVSNHQPHHRLLNHLFRRRSKITSKRLCTGLWAGNSPAIGEFPAQMASNAENVSMWWRHRDPMHSGDIISIFRKIAIG